MRVEVRVELEVHEINGISLVGVGRGTEMDYIQVEGNSDDGIEFYGGAVNVKHGVFTNNLDDSVDWDEGYQGNLQYIIVKQSSSGCLLYTSPSPRDPL